jgi:hypothetical protein
MERTNSEKKNILKSIIQGNFQEVEKLQKLMKTEKQPIFVTNHLKEGFYSTIIEGTERILSPEEFEQFEKEHNVLEIGLIVPDNMPPIFNNEDDLIKYM